MIKVKKGGSKGTHKSKPKGKGGPAVAPMPPKSPTGGKHRGHIGRKLGRGSGTSRSSH